MIDAAHLASRTFFAVGRAINVRARVPHDLAGVGAVLMLHRVSPVSRSPLRVHNGLCVTPVFLEALVSGLKADGYDFIAMDEVPARISNPTGRPFLALTFDDGYQDNADYAYPVLRRHNVPWTVYIAPGLVNADSHLWWELAELAIARRDRIVVSSAKGRLALDCASAAEKRAAFKAIHRHVLHELPEESVTTFARDLATLVGLDASAHNRTELMGWDAIRKAATDPLCTIGTHTWHHYHLARISDELLAREFSHAHAALELETGLSPRHVAYPYGYEHAVGWRETELAAALGYATGVTTRHGMLFPAHRKAITALPRISINGRHQNIDDVRIMLSGLTSWLAHRHRGPVTL